MTSNDKLALQEVISTIMKWFYDFFGYSEVPINVIITPNISEEYQKLRPELIEETIATFHEYNGLTVVPSQKGEDFMILLNRGYILDECKKEQNSWFGTIAHEATHVQDFIKYAELLNIENYESLLQVDKHRMFHMWTEFNARRNGYLFIRQLTYGESRDESQLEYILVTEMPYYIESFISQYETGDMQTQLYSVSHFLARLSVWQELYPVWFTQAYIEQVLGNEWIVLLYNFFTSHLKLSDAFQKFDEMRDILRMNFKL